MKKSVLVHGISIALVVTAATAGDQYKVVGEQGEFYFGHISYIETAEGAPVPAVFRLDARAPEAAVLNLPLGPGDTIQTPDSVRCEVQFDNGTIVRLDHGTKLKIETILAQTLSTAEKVSNLLLSQGQVYVMYRKHSSLEIFQVMTPAASVKFRDSAVALVEMEIGRTTVEVKRGRTDLLFGPNPRLLFERKVVAGQKLAVEADNVPRLLAPAPASAFLSWNEKVNADFQATHAGNVLPKPLQKLPPAVFEFAQKYGNLYGEWLWHDLYGYVWRPFFNDLRYPWGSPTGSAIGGAGWGTWQHYLAAWGNWQPYFYGEWSSYNGRLYWVPGEPWGWVPYHLGLWMWDKKSGWIWMPGSLFAPAWVDWAFWSDHYFWRPFTLFDFFEGLGGGAGLWDFTYDGPVTGDIIRTGLGRKPGDRSVRSIIDKDSLKRKEEPELPLPKEMKNALKLTAEALRKGDPGTQESLREIMRRSVIVGQADFAARGWQDKAVTLDRFLERPEVRGRGTEAAAPVTSGAASKAALRSYEALRAVSDVQARTNPTPRNPNLARSPGDRFSRGERAGSPPDAAIQNRSAEGGRPSPIGTRFKDWNPDVRAGARLGVDVLYSSRTNEVYSPQLGLRSRDIMSRPRFSTGAEGSPAFSGAGMSGATNPGSSASPGTPAGSTSSPAGSSGPRGSAKENGGGKRQD